MRSRQRWRAAKTWLAGPPRWLFTLFCWLGGGYWLLAYHFDTGFPPRSPCSIPQGTFLYLSVALLLLPFVTKLKFGNLEMEMHGSEPRERAEAPVAAPPLTPAERKLLRTLWVKQVNKFPDISQIFSFRLSVAAPEFTMFREAGGKLMARGLVGESEEGFYFLTREGFRYCDEHFAELGDSMWLAWEAPDPTKLDRIRTKMRQLGWHGAQPAGQNV